MSRSRRKLAPWRVRNRAAYNAYMRKYMRARYRRLHPKRRRWSEAEIAVLRLQYPNMATRVIAAMMERPLTNVYAKANALGLRKTAEVREAALQLVARTLHRAGAAHRFRKGQVPANKGLRRPGWGPGRMKATQFKKGQVNGKAAHHLMPVGSTRLIEGYTYIKVAAVPNVPYTVNWKALHVLTWERANGPVPAGHAVRFINGNKADTRLGNLSLVTRAEMMRRNTIHNLPGPLKEVVQLRAGLVRAINRRERGEQEDRRPT